MVTMWLWLCRVKQTFSPCIVGRSTCPTLGCKWHTSQAGSKCHLRSQPPPDLAQWWIGHPYWPGALWSKNAVEYFQCVWLGNVLSNLRSLKWMYHVQSSIELKGIFGQFSSEIYRGAVVRSHSTSGSDFIREYSFFSYLTLLYFKNSHGPLRCCYLQDC